MYLYNTSTERGFKSHGGCNGRDRMVVGFTTTCEISDLSPLKLWIRIPLMARWTRYN